MSEPRIAYLAHGRLFVRGGDGSVERLESTFADKYKDRLLKIKRQHEWKDAGRGAMFAGRTWGMDSGADPEHIHPEFTLVAPAAEADKLLYSVHAGDMCGLLERDVSPDADEEDAEQRLIHGTNRIFHSAHSDPKQEEIVCSVSGDEGLQNLAFFKPGGGGVREITEGDSLDARPSWVPGKRQIVYQSAGVGRDRDGHWIDTGPAAIELLDVSSGEIETLVGNKGVDFLAPVIAADGSLYCIRRPHKELKGHSIGLITKDILLIPWRLLQAIGGFLNVFTSAFTGKPLMTAGGPKREGPDPRQLYLHGNIIDAEKARIKAAKKGGDEAPSIVPRSWELIRMEEIGEGSYGEPEVLARGVIAFALGTSGDLVYSNGSALFRLCASARKAEIIERRKDVQEVTIL